MYINAKGFSLVSVMVSIGIAGGVALLVMKLSDNMKSVENRSTGVMDSREFLGEVRSILENERNCKLSLMKSAEAEHTFKKSEIDEPAKESGLPIELWIGNAAGTERTKKKFYDEAVFGKTRVKSIRLFMDNGAKGDYPDGPLSDLGTLKITYSFEGQGSKTLIRDFLVNVSFNTVSGLSTIKGCERLGVQSLCESLNMLYNPDTQKCLSPPEECGEYEVLAPDSGWSGWKELGCNKKDGGFVQSMIFSQSRDGTSDSNGLRIKCCYSKKYEGAACTKITVADTMWWTGNKEAFCNQKPQGFIRKIEFYQGLGTQDSNGLRVECCYPN
jgi:hypothetical protein